MLLTLSMEELKKYIAIILSIVLIDQFLKNLLSFKIKNYGASFSILENFPNLLLVISIIALIVFIYLFVKFNWSYTSNNKIMEIVLFTNINFKRKIWTTKCSLIFC